MTLAPSITDRETEKTYARLQDRILERDQAGAADVTFELMRAGRSTTEILSETVRIHAPYTHVPYHQRMDGGFVRFVNNDHALLSARATLTLQHMMPETLRDLPLAQTAWYVPSALDIWNQLLGHMPGHYGRRVYDAAAHPDGDGDAFSPVGFAVVDRWHVDRKWPGEEAEALAERAAKRADQLCKFERRREHTQPRGLHNGDAERRRARRAGGARGRRDRKVPARAPDRHPRRDHRRRRQERPRRRR